MLYYTQRRVSHEHRDRLPIVPTHTLHKTQLVWLTWQLERCKTNTCEEGIQ
jgi:hypothetical protein